jgi:hypothetical protein
MAVPSKIDLPTESPFFGKESEQQAVKRLSAIYLDKLKSGKPSGPAAKLDAAITALVKNKSADRAPMGIGVAILPEDGSPYFAGSHYDRLYSVHSIAKLALLYAAFQLRADLAVIGNTDGLAADSPYDYKSRVDDLIQAARKAFAKSNDARLKRIAATQDFPKLARMFNLWEYLKADPPHRAHSTLQFQTESYGFQDIDDEPFTSRLGSAVRASTNFYDASCICDIGLPYIQALMRRSGFATLHGTNRPGLWLSWYYQQPVVVNRIRQARQARSGDSLPPWLRDLPINQRDAITASYTTGLLNADRNPERGAPAFQSGHVGTAVGIATFLTQLGGGQLVDAGSSEAMLDYLPPSLWLARKLRGVGGGNFHGKVGYTPPHFCDSVIIQSEAIQVAATPKSSGTSDAGTPDAGAAQPPNQPRKWIAVALDALGSSDEYDDKNILEDLGTDLETAVADNT